MQVTPPFVHAAAAFLYLVHACKFVVLSFVSSSSKGEKCPPSILPHTPTVSWALTILIKMEAMKKEGTKSSGSFFFFLLQRREEKKD